MPPPHGFSWIDKPHLAGSARPDAADELVWLRAPGGAASRHAFRSPLPRHWINDAGLFAMHIPIVDMHPPSQKQIDLILGGID